MGRTRSHTRRAPRSHPHGVLVATSSGFGFVQTAEGEYFIPESSMNGAFDGDMVEVAPIAPQKGRRGRGGSRGGRAGGGSRDGRVGHDAAGGSRAGDLPAARVLRVIDRAHDTVVGRYEVAEPFGVVVPADPRIPYDIFTMRADNPDVADGALVRVRIAQFPTRHSAATGFVEEVLGVAGEPCAGVELIIARHKLETAFSEAALAEARAAKVDADGALASGYRDLRDRVVFTVDPTDAKDFDDALSLDEVEFCGSSAPESAEARRSEASQPSLCASALPGAAAEALADVTNDPGLVRAPGATSARRLWRVGVHIADVSHYAPWNSSVDLDARRRATSVYLVDRVIPMLPPELSDDVCSLVPGEDRRTMTVDLYLDDDANVVDYEIYPALIRSNARLTYDEAQAALDEDDAHGGNASEPAIALRLRELSRLAKLRAAARERAGGIDFSVPEAKVRLDGDGKPLSIDLRRKTDATQLVEEAMILANETVAAHLAKRKWPCAYRVHDVPSTDALLGLVPVLQEFPWFSEEVGGRLVTGDPRAIQEVLAASAGRAEGELVSSLMLRSMKRAVYKPENDGHYGLASKAYCHFTSPIRRYPDLVVHRMLRASLTRRPQKFDQEVNALSWMCEHASDMERTADAAARESQELKMVEYLAAYVGEAFSGVVSGVANYGLYVRLECTAEGLLPLRALGREYFAFDPARYTLIGEDTGRVYRLGQRVAVVLKVAEPETGKLELRLP